MKRKQYTRRDNYIALSILPVYYLVLNYLLFGPIYLQRLDIFLLATLSVIIIWTPIYFLHGVPALYFRRRYPAIRQTWMRLSLALIAHILMSSITFYAFFYGYDWVNFPGYSFQPERLQRALIIGIAGNILVNIVHESVYTFELWSQTLSETEKFKRANLQSQLEGLKQQINPHFLFNSLNSLSSLIDEDPERAEQFIDELASVYRYLLQTNTNELTTLATELEFIQSYYHLQRTRYGTGLCLQINVDNAYLNTLLPPLTLQLLVENAIKHNVVATDQPLHIFIETSASGYLPESDPSLSVRNNLQRRPTRVLSNGIGLVNITTKYQLLAQGGVKIEDSNDQFVVTLPLLTGQPAFEA
ncbi:sensor histidine kinase [Tellurirhabdus bombi]|uniref:sensor histidine kinase n=1 Tax=Tellurirhabdus bombi TaxID=2907205 RepID=UPI001F310591|nr:sensor histidine kinase [Tellurirhabdus bombi]